MAVDVWVYHRWNDAEPEELLEHADLFRRVYIDRSRETVNDLDAAEYADELRDGFDIFSWVTDAVPVDGNRYIPGADGYALDRIRTRTAWRFRDVHAGIEAAVQEARRHGGRDATVEAVPKASMYRMPHPFLYDLGTWAMWGFRYSWFYRLGFDAALPMVYTTAYEGMDAGRTTDLARAASSVPVRPIIAAYRSNVNDDDSTVAQVRRDIRAVGGDDYSLYLFGAWFRENADAIRTVIEEEMPGGGR